MRASTEVLVLTCAIALAAAVLQRPQPDWHCDKARLTDTPPATCSHIQNYYPKARPYTLAGAPGRIILIDAEYVDGPEGRLEVGQSTYSLFRKLGNPTTQQGDTFFWESRTEVLRAHVHRGKITELSLLSPFTCKSQKPHQCGYGPAWWRHQR